MKKILILGGTQFIGRVLVESLLEQEGLSITLFNRGKTGGELFPEVDRLIGDRNTGDIEQIGRQEWDVVIDLSCYFPHQIESSLEQVKDKVGRYVLISTCSVYDPKEGLVLRDEGSSMSTCSADQRTDESAQTYGARKAECERILSASGISHFILRPALVFGIHDHTDRFYYWLHAVNSKQELVLPDYGLITSIGRIQ